MKKLKAAVIGCGWFGAFHLQNLLKNGSVEVCALCNRGREKLESLGKTVPSARLYTDVFEMLEKEKPDFAVVCLTPDAHGETEAALCAHGVNFYVEKPVANLPDTAKKINAEIKKSGVLVSVGYQERYSPLAAKIKEITSVEPVGLVCGTWIGTMPSPLWWRTKGSSGGQITEQCTHIADMMRYLFGEAESVYTVGRRDERFAGLPHDTEDFSTSVINFKSGVCASMQTGSYIKDGSDANVGLEIFTAEHKIRYDWAKSLSVTSGGKEEITYQTQDSHVLSLEAFVRALSEGKPELILSSYDDAAKTLDLTYSAQKSLETGEIRFLCKRA